MEKCIVTQSRLLIKQWSFGFIESSPLTRSMKNYFSFAHASSFPLHEGQLFCWSIMTAVDSIKRRCAHSGMTGQVGGFQNPGVCLQAFPSFLPHAPSPVFYLRHFSRGLWLSFLVLCSYTARKRLLRRLRTELLKKEAVDMTKDAAVEVSSQLLMVSSCPTSNAWLPTFWVVYWKTKRLWGRGWPWSDIQILCRSMAKWRWSDKPTIVFWTSF